MTDKNKNLVLNNKDGFIETIIIIIIALLLMRYFNITISGTLDYFHLTWNDILGWLAGALQWLKDLFNSVK